MSTEEQEYATTLSYANGLIERLRAENNQLREERDSFQRVGIKVQEVNQRLVEALEQIYNVESLCERDSLLHALSDINQIADQALQAYKLLEKKD